MVYKFFEKRSAGICLGCSFKRQKKRVTIVTAFQSILNNSNRKLNTIWGDQGSELYNNSFKK